MLRVGIELQPVQLKEQRRRIRQVSRSAGQEVAARARFLAGRSEGGGRIYYGIGGNTPGQRWRGGYQKIRWQASLPGEPPVNVTGDLVGSFKVLPFRSGMGVAVRDTMFYARILEFGATGGGGGPRHSRAEMKKHGKRGRLLLATSRRLLPRPFLSRALAERAPSLGPRMAQAIADDVRLQRMPARRAA